MFLAFCYKCGLTRLDLEDMTIGMCFDYIAEYIELEKPAEPSVQMATQKDFDSF
jgi:hypothetical protein